MSLVRFTGWKQPFDFPGLVGYWIGHACVTYPSGRSERVCFYVLLVLPQEDLEMVGPSLERQLRLARSTLELGLHRFYELHVAPMKRGTFPQGDPPRKRGRGSRRWRPIKDFQWLEVA